MRIELISEKDPNVRVYATRKKIATRPVSSDAKRREMVDALTDYGFDLESTMGLIEGLESIRYDRYSIRVEKTPSKLWSWDEIQPQIIRAFGPDATLLTDAVNQLTQKD